MGNISDRRSPIPESITTAMIWTLNVVVPSLNWIPSSRPAAPDPLAHHCWTCRTTSCTPMTRTPASVTSAPEPQSCPRSPRSCCRPRYGKAAGGAVMLVIQSKPAVSTRHTRTHTHSYKNTHTHIHSHRHHKSHVNSHIFLEELNELPARIRSLAPSSKNTQTNTIGTLCMTASNKCITNERQPHRDTHQHSCTEWGWTETSRALCTTWIYSSFSNPSKSDPLCMKKQQSVCKCRRSDVREMRDYAKGQE